MAADIQGTLDNLANLQQALEQTSCVPLEPFIKYGTGAAPTLNYNIPQTACFSSYGNFAVRGMSPEWFQGFTQQAPENNFFALVEKMEPAVLEQKFGEAVQLRSDSAKLIPNVQLFRKHLDLANTNFDAVALGEQLSVQGIEAGGTLRPRIREASNAINEIQLARLAKEGQMPFAVETFGGYKTKLNFLRKPVRPNPYFVVIEEYKTCAYLGDYGAGRTIKTFSLLPGEKTTISVRTYKDITATQSRSENVLDSFSESSTDEMEKTLEQENGFSSADSNTSSTTDSSSRTRSLNANISASLFGIVNIGGGGSGSNTTGSSNTESSTGSRASNVRALNRALDKHVAQSNSNRQIDVNTTTSSTATQGEETSTVRELLNYNKSRVLNFVFRQLLQEYVTITYLTNIRVAYCNGYAESLRVVDIEDLDNLLKSTINPANIDAARIQILKPYCAVMNYEDDPIQFIEPFDLNYGECLGINETERFWRIKKGIRDTYSSGGLEIEVKGVIQSVSTQTLRTSSVIVDSLLGQGEALDCFNQKSQDAAAVGEQLKNLEQLQKMEAIENISDPGQRAELYKKVFGSCCDVPQTQIIS